MRHPLEFWSSNRLVSAVCRTLKIKLACRMVGSPTYAFVLPRVTVDEEAGSTSPEMNSSRDGPESRRCVKLVVGLAEEGPGVVVAYVLMNAHR